MCWRGSWDGALARVMQRCMSPGLYSPNPRPRRGFLASLFVISRLLYLYCLKNTIDTLMSSPFKADIHLNDRDFMSIRRSGYISLDLWTPQRPIPTRMCYCLHCKHVYSLTWTQKHLKRIRNSINVSGLFNPDKVELYRNDIFSELQLMNERRRFSSPRQSRMFLPLPLRDDPAAWETIGTNQAGIEAFSRDGLEQDCSEQLMREEGPSDDSDNDTVQEMEPVIECLLKNSFFRSEFEGEKFISLADCVMQRATLCSEEKRIHIIKAGIVSSLARKLSSILCLTKTQTEQLFRFWKTMIVFVSPQSEEISRRIHASYSSCVRHTLRDEQQKKNACRRYFGECSFFSIALDSTLVRNENLLSCFARFSFHDHIIQVPVFFDICHDKTGNGIAQFVFTKLLENDVVFEKLVSVCTDGASNMTGRFGGMTSVLKQLVQQHCTRMGRPFNDFHTVWCLAHRMNLVTKDFLELKGLNIVKAFSDWFSDSHRQTAYKTFVAERACNQRLKSIPRPSNTRWLFYHDVVSAILSQRESVVDFIAGNEDFQKL